METHFLPLGDQGAGLVFSLWEASAERFYGLVQAAVVEWWKDNPVRFLGGGGVSPLKQCRRVTY